MKESLPTMFVNKVSLQVWDISCDLTWRGMGFIQIYFPQDNECLLKYVEGADQVLSYAGYGIDEGTLSVLMLALGCSI